MAFQNLYNAMQKSYNGPLKLHRGVRSYSFRRCMKQGLWIMTLSFIGYTVTQGTIHTSLLIPQMAWTKSSVDCFDWSIIVT